MNSIERLLANELPNINNKLHDINSGGCGWYAFLVCKALNAVGVQAEVVLVGGYGYNTSCVNNVMQEWGDINTFYAAQLDIHDMNGGKRITNLCNGHMAVRYDGALYDCEGRFCYEAISEGISLDNMARMVDAHCWNDWFVDANNGEFEAVYAMTTFINDLIGEW